MDGGSGLGFEVQVRGFDLNIHQNKDKKYLSQAAQVSTRLLELLVAILLLNALETASFELDWLGKEGVYWLLLVYLCLKNGILFGVGFVATCYVLFGDLTVTFGNGYLDTWTGDSPKERWQYLYGFLICLVIGVFEALRKCEENDLKKSISEKALELEAQRGVLNVERRRSERLLQCIEGNKCNTTYILKNISKLHSGRTDLKSAVHGFLEMSSIVLGVEACSLWRVRAGEGYLYCCIGWQEGDISDNKKKLDEGIYHKLVLGRQTLSVLEKDERRIMHGHGVLAVPILSADKSDLVGVLKVEKIPFESYNKILFVRMKYVADIVSYYIQ